MATSKIKTAVLDQSQRPTRAIAMTVSVEVTQADGISKRNIEVNGVPANRADVFMGEVRDAIRESEFEYPRASLKITLDPELPDTAQHDLALPVTLGILAASGQLPENVAHDVQRSFVIGSLNRDGDVGEWFGRRQVERIVAEAGAAIIGPAQIPSLAELSSEKRLMEPPEPPSAPQTPPARDVEPKMEPKTAQFAGEDAKSEPQEPSVPDAGQSQKSPSGARGKADHRRDDIKNSEDHLGKPQTADAGVRTTHPESVGEKTAPAASSGAEEGAGEGLVYWTSQEPGFEGSYDALGMLRLYEGTVNKSDYPDFDGWLQEMERSAIFFKHALPPKGDSEPRANPIAPAQAETVSAFDRKAAEDALVEAKDEASKLGARLEEAEQRAAALEQKYNQAAADVSAIRDRAWGAEAERDEVKAQADKLKGELAAVLTRNAELESAAASGAQDQANAELESALSRLQAENAQFVEWVEDLEQQLGEARAEQMRSEQLLNSRDSEIESLKEALAAAQAESVEPEPRAIEDITLKDFKYVSAIGVDKIVKQYELDLPDGTLMTIYPAQGGPNATGKWDWESLQSGTRTIGRAESPEQAVSDMVERITEPLAGGRLPMPVPATPAYSQGARSVDADVRDARLSATRQVVSSVPKTRETGVVLA